MTNFERIKQVINEIDETDLAEWIDDTFLSGRYSQLRCRFCTEKYTECDDKCERHIRKWLKQDAEEIEEKE